MILTGSRLMILDAMACKEEELIMQEQGQEYIFAVKTLIYAVIAIPVVVTTLKKLGSSVWILIGLVGFRQEETPVQDLQAVA